MSKISFDKKTLLYPIPIVIVGVQVEGKANFVTVGDVAVLGLQNPSLMCISLNENHHSTKGIHKNQTFSINVPGQNILAETDYCGVRSGKDVDKARLFKVFYKNNDTIPMIEECPVNIMCKVVETVCIKHRTIFIAEVIETFVSEHFVEEKDGKKVVLPINKLEPICYALDNKYYKVGEAVGTGYSEFKKIEEKSI